MFPLITKKPKQLLPHLLFVLAVNPKIPKKYFVNGAIFVSRPLISLSILPFPSLASGLYLAAASPPLSLPRLAFSGRLCVSSSLAAPASVPLLVLCFWSSGDDGSSFTHSHSLSLTRLISPQNRSPNPLIARNQGREADFGCDSAKDLCVRKLHFNTQPRLGLNPWPRDCLRCIYRIASDTCDVSSPYA